MGRETQPPKSEEPQEPEALEDLEVEDEASEAVRAGDGTLPDTELDRGERHRKPPGH